MDTWAQGRGLTTIDEVVHAIAQWISAADGITVSGGEPFDQREALLELIRRIRCQSDADVLVFTGYPWTQVRGLVDWSTELIDALVTGPFDINENQNLALRGSDNQELHLMTAKGRARFASFERAVTGLDRAVDIMFDDQGNVWFAGIPARDDFRRLQELLVSAGAKLSISEDKRFSSARASSA